MALGVSVVDLCNDVCCAHRCFKNQGMFLGADAFRVESCWP